MVGFKDSKLLSRLNRPMERDVYKRQVYIWCKTPGDFNTVSRLEVGYI